VPFNVRLLQDIFQKEGFRTIAASGVKKGRALACTENPTIADIYDALRNARGYKPAFDHWQAYRYNRGGRQNNAGAL